MTLFYLHSSETFYLSMEFWNECYFLSAHWIYHLFSGFYCSFCQVNSLSNCYSLEGNLSYFLSLSASFKLFFSLYFIFLKITMACLEDFFLFLIETVWIFWNFELVSFISSENFWTITSWNIISASFSIFCFWYSSYIHVGLSTCILYIVTIYIASSTRGYINLNKINLN